MTRRVWGISSQVNDFHSRLLLVAVAITAARIVFVAVVAIIVAVGGFVELIEFVALDACAGWG
jgi:hypothetical protein